MPPCLCAHRYPAPMKRHTVESFVHDALQMQWAHEYLETNMIHSVEEHIHDSLIHLTTRETVLMRFSSTTLCITGSNHRSSTSLSKTTFIFLCWMTIILSKAVVGVASLVSFLQILGLALIRNARFCLTNWSHKIKHHTCGHGCVLCPSFLFVASQCHGVTSIHRCHGAKNSGKLRCQGQIVASTNSIPWLN